MSIFKEQRLQKIYEEIVDEKITEYNDELEEISVFEQKIQEYPEILEGLLEYSRGYNSLDTKETTLFKKARDENIPSVYLTKNGERYFNLDVDDFQTLDDLKEIWKELDLLPNVSFKDYIDFVIYNSEDDSLGIEISKVYKEVILDDYEDTKYWDEKISELMDKDEEILNKIYTRQVQLLTNTINPYIQKAVYNTKSRTISYDVYESEGSVTTSIYDKFVFKNPTEEIPFMKLYNVNVEETYKIYSQMTKQEINVWNSIDENVDKNIPFSDESPFIFFLLKWGERGEQDNTNSLQKISYCKCYLSSDRVYVKVPSSLQINDINTFFERNLRDIFEVEIDGYKEENVVIEAKISDLEYIDRPIFQYYLLSDENSPLFIDEKERNITAETRKIRFYNKSYIENFEPYVIKYEKSYALNFTISGPEEEGTINFFREIFGRYINGFLLRKHALKTALTRLIESPDGISSYVKIDKTKQKKETFKQDPHTHTFKKKVDYIKSLIKIPEKDYSRDVQCKNQPIILTEEEANIWLKTKRNIFSTDTKNPTRDIMKWTNTKGHELYFTCPNDKLPIIHFIKETAGKDGVYEFSPRCLTKKRLYNQDEITILERGDSGLENVKSMKSFNETNVDEDKLINPSIKKRSYLSLELKHILAHLLEIKYENIKLIYPYPKTTNHMALSILSAVINKQKIAIEDLRNKIADNTNPMLVSQEAIGLGVKPEELVENFRNPSTLVNTEIHFRMLEEYFNIHIFVFRLRCEDPKKQKKVWEISRDFDMEIPTNKIFHVRSLKKNRKCVILLKTLETQDYAIIGDRRNKSVFGPEVTIRMMEMFYEMSRYTISKDNYIYTNLYSKYHWQDFIPEDPIVAQEIDIVGKCRVIQTESGLTIQVPPTDPFNVPLIEEYTKTEYQKVENLFGSPTMKDEKGVYYSYHGIPNMISVICRNVTFEPETTYEIPMSIFQGQEETDVEISLYHQLKRATYALIQIIQWGWCVDYRPNFKEWFRNFVDIVSEPEDPYSILPEQIFTYLPKVEDPRDGFRNINRWWPEIFSRNGNMKIWSGLYEKIIGFFENEEKVIGGYTRSREIPLPNLVGFYETPEDYPTPCEVRVFQSRKDFNQWHRMDRIREENPSLGVIEVTSFENIKDIMEKKNYFRVKVKNHFFIIKNFEKNEKDEAIKQSLNILGIPEEEPYGINIYAFSKKYEIVLKETSFENIIIDLIMYPNETYGLIHI